MANNLPHVLNLSNSIIGVTILAMPFCFKQCGILLGALLLFFCTWLTLVSCRLLMKAGVTSRRRSYGFLAYYTYGAPGKLAVEIGMIGLQLGTLIAQVVIIGDLGPAIVSKFLGLENNSNLRTGLICFLCLCVGLPLGLLKNLNTVSRASTLCIVFYGLFTVYVFSLSIPNLVAGDWISRVNVWKTDGLFKCLPIFSFAFGCQTQLFIMYDNLPEPSLKSVNSIVQSAVNMCTVCYLLTGFFGYIAFHQKDIGGDIVTDFEVSLMSDILKLGFVISIAITFPLIIFPCRGSLYTLLFPQKPKHNEDLEKRPVIPELHFKVLTFFIVVGSMITGILVPNVEFVLAMNGATMGTLICYIFPAVFFLRVMTGSSDGKQIAQAVLVFGFLIMILCTITTLNSQEQAHTGEVSNVEVKNEAQELIPKEKPLQPPVDNVKPSVESIKEKPPDDGRKDTDQGKDKRVEPPNPREPSEKENESNLPGEKLDSKQIVKQKDKPQGDKEGKSVEEVNKQLKEGQDEVKKGLERGDSVDEGLGQLQGPDKVNLEGPDKVKLEGADKVKLEGGDKVKQEEAGKVKLEEAGKDKLEEKEDEKDKKESVVEANDRIKQKEIIVELEKQREEQRELIEEQKEILAQLKEHEQEHKQIEADQQAMAKEGDSGGKVKMENVQQQGQQSDTGKQGKVVQQVQQQHGAGQLKIGDKQQAQQQGGGVQQVQQPVGGVRQQQPAAAQQQPIGGVQQVQQPGAVLQPIEGVRQQQPAAAQQQPIGGVQQVQQPEAVQQPIGGVRQQQPAAAQQQPIGGVRQQQPAAAQHQPIGGVRQVQQPGAVQQPVGGVRQQQPAAAQQQPIGGVRQQQPAAAQQQPIGGVQQVQQPGAVQQSVGGVRQQQPAAAQQQPIGGVQQVQQPGAVQQPVGGVREPEQRNILQPGLHQGDNNGYAANVLNELGVDQLDVKQNLGAGLENKEIPKVNIPDDIKKEPVQQKNQAKLNLQDNIEDNNFNKHSKKKSSKKHKTEHKKEEIRRRRDVGDMEESPNNDNIPLQDNVHQKKTINDEMRRKKLSVDENLLEELDMNDVINKFDSQRDLSYVHGRSLKSLLNKKP